MKIAKQPTWRRILPGAVPKKHRKGVLYLAVLGLLWTATPSDASPDTAGLFEPYQVEIGAARRQAILTGSFLDAEATGSSDMHQIAVISIGGNANRRVRIYAFNDGSWASAVEAKLGAKVSLVDVANIGGRDRLITYQPGRINWFDPASAREKTLLVINRHRRRPAKHEMHRVEMARDLNHDGRDDLILPDSSGFWIATQLDDGSFSQATKLGPEEPFLDEIYNEQRYGDMGLTAETIPWYLSRVHEADYNQDGRSDLVFWDQDHFEVHLQGARGQFTRTPVDYTSNVPFDSDGSYSLLFGHGDRSTFSLVSGLGKMMKRTVLRSMRDMNGDDVPDLVLQTIEGRALTRLRSNYQVFYGKQTKESISFNREGSTEIRPRGKAGGIGASGYASQEFHDFDADGQIDIMFRDVHIGFGGIMRALAGNSVAIDLEFYRTEDATDLMKPATRRRIRRFAPFAGLGNVFFPAVLLGDVNGDNRWDLLVGHSPTELHVFVGVSGPELIARKPESVPVDLPSDPGKTWLADLNRDGKQDVLMHHPSKDENPHRLTTLIAR